MANTLRIKRRALGGASGAPSSLAQSELAYSEVDGVLHIGVGTGGSAAVVAIGGPGAYLTSATAASTYLTSATASSTYLTSASASSTYLPLTGGTISQNLTITGNLTVNGTTTTIASSTLSIADKNIELAKGSTTDAAADGGGITIHAAADYTFNWVASTSAWTSSTHMDLASSKAYKIAGTNVLTATALGSGVTSSSLTSVGALASGSLASGFTAVAVAQGGTGLTSAVSGLLKGNGSAYSAATAGTDYLDGNSTLDCGTF
jgi:hypothetical protein